MNALDWPMVSEAFLATRAAEGAWVPIVEALRSRPLEALTERLVATASEDDRSAARDFLLLAIRHAVVDHSLTEEEVLQLRHVARLLRVEEGDLLEHNRKEVRDLLCNELQRLLEDRRVDPMEAVHKVRLQEVLGLGYDQFVALTMPVIEGVVKELVLQIDPDPALGPTEEDVQWFRRSLAALDTIYHVHPKTLSTGGSGGYLYLLVNPSMPGLLKIGRTNRIPGERMTELAAATGVPTPFILVYDLFVQDSEAAERYVHDRLEELGFRVSENREFFTATPAQAIDLMREARDTVRTL